VNRRFLGLLLVPMIIGVLVTGCASGPSLMSYDANQPQTFLAGAEIEQAKSLAMGSAVTKGWKIVESSDNRLLVRRALPASAESYSGETVEVQTDFFQRPEGVDVVVKATVISRGEKGEKRADYTETYREPLNQSLNSLRRSWDENRWRIASATPPLPTKVAETAEDGAQGEPQALEGAQTAAPVAGTQPTVEAASTWTSSPSAPPDPVGTAPAAGAAAPVENRSAGSVATGAAAVTAAGSASTAPPPQPPAAPGGAPNGMLALNRSGATGVWSYYAEHYAKIRGCALTAEGAVLEEKKPEYEMHRVYCEGGQTFLVKCNAGTCRGMQ
jgi:hypothetical protein